MAGDARGGAPRGGGDRSGSFIARAVGHGAGPRTGASGRRSPDVSATFPAELALDRVRAMLQDEDKRVIPSVLGALARLKATDARATSLLEQLEGSRLRRPRDRGARELGELKPRRRGRGAARGVQDRAWPDAAYPRARPPSRRWPTYGPAEARRHARARRSTTRTGRFASAPASCWPSSIRSGGPPQRRCVRRRATARALRRSAR